MKLKFDTGTLGAISEHKIIIDLLSQGFMVFRNCSPTGSTDLIALGRGEYQKPLRIEVRTVMKFENSGKAKPKYQLKKHFDHYAKIHKVTGEIRYVPALPGPPLAAFLPKKT